MSRPRILLTWELGEGLGHIRPMAFLGHQLIDQGYELVFACRQPLLAAREIHPSLGKVIAAPYQHRPHLSLGDIRNYASILQIQGYSDETELIPLVRAWRDTIDLVKPDLIIADHSPSVLLAARGHTRVVQIGTGFTIPPCQTRRFPDLNWNDETALAPAADARILHMVNRALSHFGDAELDALPEMMDTAGRCVFSLPELDPYRKFREDILLGPLEPLPRLSLYPPDLRVFAYLSAEYSEFDTVARILTAASYERSAYVRGLTDVQTVLLETAGLPLARSAAPLTEVLPPSSLIIHHGGLATTQAALFAGRPQIILPQHNEARHTANVVSELGVSLTIEPNEIRALPDAIQSYLSNRNWREAAMACARSLRAREMPDPVEGFLATVLKAFAKPVLA